MSVLQETASTVVNPRKFAVETRNKFDELTSEQALSDYYAGYMEHADSVEPGDSPSQYVLRRPGASLAAVAAIVRLPSCTAALSSSFEGRWLHHALSKKSVFGLPFGSLSTAVLEVPEVPGQYSLGATRQTPRRKARSSSKAGVTYRFITDAEERRELLALGNRNEQEHLDERYRSAQPDNSETLQMDLWIAAFDADQRPLLLSVTPIDGEWACLRYFRTLGRSTVHSDSRYLMTQVLVEELSRRGVRHLFDSTHPATLSNGLRHFQRMVGFRLQRVTARLM